jgi:biotin transporter BioY
MSTTQDIRLPNFQGGSVKKAVPLAKQLAIPPRLSLNLLVLSCFALLATIMLGFQFVALPCINPFSINPVDYFRLAGQSVPYIQYSFQLVGMVLLGSMLGPLPACLLGISFLAVGLFVFPVFANGGGVSYILQPGFGYLLGSVFATALVSLTFHSLFKPVLYKSTASKSAVSHPVSVTSKISASKLSGSPTERQKVPVVLLIFQLAFQAVLTIHVTGLLYLLALATLHQLPWAELPGWSTRLTADVILYDMLFMFSAVAMVRLMRLPFWLILY